jgi:hypothetical protein
MCSIKLDDARIGEKLVWGPDREQASAANNGWFSQFNECLGCHAVQVCGEAARNVEMFRAGAKMVPGGKGGGKSGV